MVLTWRQARLSSEDYGKHLMGVEDLLQKQSLLEADINIVGDRVKTINGQAQKFVDEDFPEAGGDGTTGGMGKIRNTFVCLCLIVLFIKISTIKILI